MLTGEKRDRGGVEDARKREGGGWKTKWSLLSSCCTNPASSFPYCPSLRCYLPQPNKEEGLKKAPVERRKGLSKKEFGRGEGGGKPPELGDFFVFIRGPSYPWGNTKIRMGGGTN